MYAKPKGCVGCPFFGDGKGFVPDAMVEGAEVLTMAQNPGDDEERGYKVTGYSYGQATRVKVDPTPLIGATGYKLERSFFPPAGLTRENTSVGNVLRCRPKHTNTLPLLDNPQVREAMQHCQRAHFRPPSSTKLIVAQGEYALWAMTGEGLIKKHHLSDWRGYVVPFSPCHVTPRPFLAEVWTPSPSDPIPVLIVAHTAAIWRQPSLEIISKRDWAKVPRILSGAWPVQPPQIIVEPPPVWPQVFAFDTEFVVETKALIRYSMYHEAKGKQICRVVEAEDATQGGVVTVKPLLIFQNAPADLNHWEDISELKWGEYDIEDTMHAHAVLWSGLRHNLNFLGSLYATINRWKHLDQINPIQYSGLDGVGTWDVWFALKREFDRDPQSLWIYRNSQLKLVNVIRNSASLKGIRVNQEKSREIAAGLVKQVEEFVPHAQALVGWPINIGSDLQTKKQLYDVERILELALPGRKK